jgi:hypothetical protein
MAHSGAREEHEEHEEEAAETEVIASDMSAIGQAAMANNGAVTGQQSLPPTPPPPAYVSVLTTALLDNLPSTHAPLHLLPRMLAWVQEAEEIRAELAKGVPIG